MRKSYALILPLISLLPLLAQSAEFIITDSGREVELQEDGSWAFVSEDIFATNAEGQRIRLRPDGSWQVLNENNDSTQHRAVFQAPSIYEPIQFSLKTASIENYRKVVPGLNKNTRLQSQSVFYLEVSNTADQTSSNSLSLNADTISLLDSEDDSYQLISILPRNLTIEPGETKEVELRFDGAPSWRLGKIYYLSVSSELLASDKDLTFTIPLSEIRTASVNGF